GLFCCGWHTPWEYLKEDALIATVTYNKVLGNENLVVPGLPGEMTNSADAWRKTAKEFEELSGRLSYYGMRLGYHNHDSEFTETEGIIPFDHFFETAPGADIQLDNGNALSSGTGYDIYAPLRRFPFRMKTTHLKPYSAKDGYATMIGQDDIDWAKYFSLCYEHQDIDWFIVEYECEEKHGQLEGVEECLKALKKMERGGMI
ncbi:MAG: TIM barrel protein, partial [Defluviitaleaceae bacterium]|nr:TIM barrel protein [Defluviitaleaceae bacterium]